MKSNIFLRVITFCFSFLFFSESPAAALGGQEASVWAEEKGKELLSVFADNDLSEKYARLDAFFLKNVDLEYIGRFVVGKYWNMMTPDEKDEYLELFRRYALAAYKGFPLQFKEEVKFRILRAQVKENSADVTAEVFLETPPASDSRSVQNILLTLQVYKTADGIKIRDLKLAESSLILSYRGKFYQMLSENDGEISWFMEDLRLKTESLERANRQRLEGEYPYEA